MSTSCNDWNPEGACMVSLDVWYTSIEYILNIMMIINSYVHASSTTQGK